MTPLPAPVLAMTSSFTNQDVFGLSSTSDLRRTGDWIHPSSVLPSKRGVIAAILSNVALESGCDVLVCGAWDTTFEGAGASCANRFAASAKTRTSNESIFIGDLDYHVCTWLPACLRSNNRAKQSLLRIDGNDRNQVTTPDFSRCQSDGRNVKVL